jgi:prepilin-type N-terminal cleavage/methylation domain-containing protein
MRNKTNTYGFTLIELLIVLSIFTILSGLMMMVYGSARKDSIIKNAESTVVAYLNTARTMAITQPNVRTGDPFRDYVVAIYFETPQSRKIWIDEVVLGASVDGIIRSTTDPYNEIITPKVMTPAILPDEINLIISASSGSLARSNVGRNVYYITFRFDGSSDYAVLNLINKKDGTSDSRNYDSVVVYPATGRARIYNNEKK